MQPRPAQPSREAFVSFQHACTAFGFCDYLNRGNSSLFLLDHSAPTNRSTGTRLVVCLSLVQLKSLYAHLLMQAPCQLLESLNQEGICYQSQIGEGGFVDFAWFLTWFLFFEMRGTFFFLKIRNVSINNVIKYINNIIIENLRFMN